MNKLILFLVEKTLERKLTTRGLKSEEDKNYLFFLLFNDLEQLEVPKTFNELISEIKSKPDKEVTNLEKNLIELDSDISIIKNKALLNITQQVSNTDEDTLVKSIIYIWTYDALNVLDKTKYWNKNLPLLSLATMCRTTTDLLLAYIFRVSTKVEHSLKNEWMSLSKNEICFIFNLNADNTNDKEWKQKKQQMPFLRKNINKSIEKNKINSLYKILNNLFNTPKTGLQFSKYLELFIQDLFEIKKIDETTKNDIISNIFSIKELVTGRFEHSPRTIFNKIIHNIYNIFDDEKILNLWVENIKIYIHFYNWFLTKIGWLQEKNNKI